MNNNSTSVNYGKWTIKQLTAELKKRKAKTTGKKADLVQRLHDYDKLFIKAVPEDEDNSYNLIKPDAKLYKDLNASHSLNIESSFESEYLSSIQASVNNSKGEKMYNDSYLISLRKACNDENETFLCARVASQFRKSVVYNVDVKITPYKCVSDTQCECAAGKGPTAHCKHVCVVFQAIKDFIQNKNIKTRQTCIEQLQTFHQTKKYTGSPIKIKHMHLQKTNLLDDKLEDYDPRPTKYRKMNNFKPKFRNMCINYAAVHSLSFPELQLFESANLFAVYNDHDYTKKHAEQIFLESMNLLNVTPSTRLEIESLTRGQSDNKCWFTERSLWINSSCFGTICSTKDPALTLVHNLITPKDLSHLPAIQHGKKYELHAIKQFEALTDMKVIECGTFVSSKYPFLASSPDGIVNDLVCVEVKCPFSAKDQLISPKTVNYLSCDKGVYKLKKNHNYYYQVQGQLYCAEKEICIFIVYTIKDILLLEITRDEKFIDEMIEKLVVFYEKYFKKAILEKHLYKNY